VKPWYVIRLEIERQGVHVASAPWSAHGVKPAPWKEDSACWACRELHAKSGERWAKQSAPSPRAGVCLKENVLLQSMFNAGQVFSSIYSNSSFYSGVVFFAKVLLVIFSLSRHRKA